MVGCQPRLIWRLYVYYDAQGRNTSSSLLANWSEKSAKPSLSPAARFIERNVFESELHRIKSFGRTRARTHTHTHVHTYTRKRTCAHVRRRRRRLRCCWPTYRTITDIFARVYRSGARNRSRSGSPGRSRVWQADRVGIDTSR